MKTSSIIKRVLFVLLFLFSPALIFSPAADGADHIIPHQTYLEEFFWTYGCTPTAASMVLSYWDTSHLEYGGKYIGSGRLIDYYLRPSCGGYNVPNTLRELKNGLDTDYNINSCSGLGLTDPWNIDDGIRHVTNTVNGYDFHSSTSCSAIWPEVFGDWCWDEIRSEIDIGRPFVWSTGNLSLQGHSVAAWGYTDSKYVILYDTWEPAGRVDWYYTHYLGDPDNSIEGTQVNIAVPLQPADADISLDEPVGGETLFAGSTYRIWWYMWGTRITRVEIHFSYDWGRNWSFVGTSAPSHPDGWGSFNWTVPNTPSGAARVRIEAYDSAGSYIAGDGSFGDFRILVDNTPPVGSVAINNGVDFTNSLSATLSLTCADGTDGIGCADMRFSNDNLNWTAWQAFAATRAWTLSAGDGLKTVYVQYRDRLGNQSPTYSDTITLDTTGPPGTISIANGQVCTFSRSVTLYLTCTGCVEMRFYDIFTHSYTPWEPFAATRSWTIGGVADPMFFQICAEFRDISGNATPACDNILLDSIPEPTGSVVINDQNFFTHTPAVTLALTCSEVCSGCSDMRFSADNVTWTAWEPFAPAKTWNLSSPDGPKTVYTEFRSGAGYTLTTQDEIFLDTVPPVGTVTINGGAPTVAGTSVNLILTCSDAVSQCTQMRFSNDKSTWSDWQAFYTSNSWSLAPGDGLKTVFAQFRDSAGNLATFSDTIEIQTLFATSTIDTDETSGYLNSIAVDSNDHVHIAYQREYFEWDDWFGSETFKFDLKYATNAGGSWVITTVEEGGYQMVYPSIAIDSAGHVHIAYSFGDQISGGRSNVKYATNRTGAWVVSRVDDADNVGRHTSLALDSNDKAHISYYDEQNFNLKYATDLSGSWEMITLDSSGGAGEYVGEYSSISVDSNNRPHIAYHFRIFANAYLKYARNIIGVWEISQLTYDQSRRSFASIAVDRNNHVHIVSSYETGGLEYRNNIIGQWAYQTIPTIGHVGMNPSISLDRSDKVHIAYTDGTNSDLMYANNISGSWYTASADSQGYVGVNPSIALDSNDVVHMIHYDISNGDLKYARSPDLTAPAGSILIAGGAEYTNSGAVALALSAADPSGVAEMCLSDTPSCSSWEAYAASKPWTLPAGSGSKIVYAWFRDALGNVNDVPLSDTIILDTFPPSGSVLINSGGSHTNNPLVILSLSALDEHSGIASMRFSNDEVSWSPWEPYSPSKTWNLGAGDGDRTVYVQFRDNAQNASGSFADGIVLDTTSLKGDIDRNGHVDLADAISVLQVITGLETAQPVDINADVNGDGKLGLSEVIYILQTVAE